MQTDVIPCDIHQLKSYIPYNLYTEIPVLVPVNNREQGIYAPTLLTIQYGLVLFPPQII